MSSPIIKQILKFNRGRDPNLLRLKLKRMAASAFAFFRGSDHLFASAWRELAPDVPDPRVLSCCDLHLENFGIFAADDGKVRFGINDFDEALVAPASFDLVRCTASIFLAAEDWQLLPITAAQMALAFLANYGMAVRQAAGNDRSHDVFVGGRRDPVFKLIAGNLGSPRSLINEYTKKDEQGIRLIVRNKKHFKLNRQIRRQVEKAVKAYGKHHDRAKEFTDEDVTGRVAGIGSLGVPRYTVLIRGKKSAGRRLLDIKGAEPSAAAEAIRLRQPNFRGNEALRVVTAQRTIQGVNARGLDVLQIGQRNFRMRDMIPDENRVSLDTFREQPDRLMAAISLAGKITGWAHCRGVTHNIASIRHLIQWTDGSALNAILASAIRFADRTNHQYQAFMAS